MSMHLASHAFTTLSTRKRKGSIVIDEQLRKDYQEYNRLMKRIGAKTKTIEEYARYRQGKAGAYKAKPVKDPFKTAHYQRPSPDVPSGDGIGVSYTKREEKAYTGGNLVGIATMHKSNMVPVFKQEDAEEIAKMRR